MASKRSPNLNLEEGTERQLSQKLGVEIEWIRSLPRSCYGIVAKFFLHMKKTDPQGPLGLWIFLILCIIGISLDPLFFYIPVINDDQNCLKFDKKLGTTAIILRSVFDLFHIIYIISRLDTDFFAPFNKLYGQANSDKDVWTVGKKYLLRFFPIDLLAILPLPQMVILLLVPTMRGSELFTGMKLLKFFLFFQYVPRVIRIYPLFKKATRISDVFDEAIWAKAAFNLLLYMLAGHVFGALWYFFALERLTVCWNNACINHTGCSQGSFNCNRSSGDYKFLNDFCSTKTQNTVAFDFGMFHDALQSGIVEVTDFPQKFLHCFQWGLQNLSCFGQNLQTSTFIWENFFAVWITISGLVLFLFLIGNMQTYLQSKTIRSEEMRLKGREIEQWMSFGKLSENLQQQVKKHQRYIWRETNGVDVDNLLNNLPKDLRMNIKRELCSELLKKVEEFKKLNETILDALCDCVKPAFYIERTHIIREGDPIDEMLFIVHGKLWTYTSKAKTTATASASASASMSTEHQKENKNCKIKDHLKDGDFCGEELIAWALDEPSSSNLPMSTRTIQALTKVEAFALMADDLKNVFIKYQLSKSSGLSWNNLVHAARVIQNFWRHRHNKTNWQRSAGEIEPESQLISPELQVMLEHGASALINDIQGVRSSERALAAPSQHRSAEPEIKIEDP